MPAKTSEKKSITQAVAVIIILGVILLVSFGFVWWQFVRNDPKNVFESMLVNNLRTGSVTRTVEQDSGSQQVKQVIRLQNRTKHVAHGRTTLVQNPGNDQKTVVVTESIGTVNADYVRYVSIDTKQKDSKGEGLNFDLVIGKWGKSEPANVQGIGDLYSENALGLFLFADLPANQREELISIINENNVYETSYNAARKTTENGRPYYNYRVTIQPSSYVAFLKQYAEYVGLTQIQNINPDDYKGADPLVFNVKVDILSQRLASISALAAQRTEKFGSYGIFEDVELPKDTIELPELQNRLNQSTSGA